MTGTAARERTEEPPTRPPARERGERPPVRADLSLRTVGKVLGGIPSFGRLLYRLMKDARVSPLDRALFGFTLAYLVWPVDLVPDWLAFLGQADDLVLLTLALGRLLYRTDEAVLLEHWEGGEESFLLLEDLLERLSGALPWWARRLLRAGG